MYCNVLFACINVMHVFVTFSVNLENDVDVGLRKARSNSFSSSLRRIFRIDKKDVSREGSLSRPAANKTDPYNRDLSLSQQEAFDRSRRQNTPIPSDTQYSISMPSAPSPLQLR